MLRLSTETRQAQIKEAVLEIISTEGLAKLSTKNLAAKVGVSEGAIYRHFKSKKDILLSIIEDVYTNLVVNQKEIANSEMVSSIKLYTFFCKQIQYLIHNKGITILLFSEATHTNDSILKEKLLKILKAQKTLLKQIVAEGISNGSWNKSIDINDFATLYMGIPVILNIEMVLNKENFNHEEFCNRMFSLLERILKP
ncbi:TetR/AcrR family transcriptional regulator [Lutibacter sp.]|uniref:TetR/AcrR family transcriptional regulator n=1 Tax=Lutibacter sp. TaxID=1925666 RepID=UPI0025BFAC11|nr:TetR/AcrR family transcriptional regulator [Lutibacter sp.]MCF6167667.1 TetR/AcrR family transcriptional regulator [Lutibacter sp.]